jgi:hypothetical protein
MKKWIVVIFILAIIFLYMPMVKADNGDEAIKKTTEAISKTEMGKQVSKSIESAVNKVLPVDKDTAAVIGSVAATAVQGKIDTKSIKNMDIDMAGGSVRPDVEYNFKDNDSSFLVKYNLSF